MTVVLVHGNPETDAIWAPLLAKLGRDDVTCLSPPGFGAPVPDGFAARYTDYRDWLVGELERFDEPVDLVGHDWGGGHVVHVAMTRPDLLRSWASDALGIYHPDYVWHELAQVWQRPGDGEHLVDVMMTAPVEQRIARLTALGITRQVAEGVATGQGPEMGRCILALYRSAAQPALRELGAQLPAAARTPGLALVASEDHYVGSEQMHRDCAGRANARVAVLPGLGHWWMVRDPALGAALLTEFWDSV